MESTEEQDAAVVSAVEAAHEIAPIETQGVQTPSQLSAVDVSGGNFQTANFGPQTQNVTLTKKEKTVHQTYHGNIEAMNIHYHQQGASASTEIGAGANAPSNEQSHPDWIELKGSIRMFHNRKLGGRNNVFHGEQPSEVTGIRQLAIKSLPFSDIHIREAKLLKNLKHPNVVNVVHSDSFFLGPMKQMYIAMERCNDQNLFDYILEQKRQHRPFDRQKYFGQAKQLVEGLRYIHSRNIIHRDLKPHNILLSLCGLYLKIADFGLSKAMTSGCSVTAASISRVGTDGYRAPETYNSNQISKLADIFSLALALFFILSYGLHPFGDDPDAWNLYIKRCERYNLDGMLVEDIENAVNLLRWMLQRLPRQRPTADEVLHHSFFSTSQLLVTQRRSSSPHRAVSSLPRPHRSSEPQVQLSAQLSRLHMSESAPSFPVINPQQEFPSVFNPSFEDFDFIAHRSTPTPEPDDAVLETKRRTQSEAPSIVSLPPPPENPRRRRKLFSSPVTITSARTQPASADSSPSTSFTRESGILRGRAFGFNIGEEPRHELPSTHRNPRPRSLPDEPSVEWLQEPMEPHVLHPGKRQNTNGLLLFVKPSATITAFDPKKMSWRKAYQFPEALTRQRFTAVVSGKYVYVLASDRRVFRLDLTEQNSIWEDMPSMSGEHGDWPPAVALNDLIYVLGSSGGSSFHSTSEVEKFIPGTSQWNSVKPMINQRHHHATVAARACIYCIGGQGKSILRSVDKFCPKKGQWSPVSPMNHSRICPAATAHEGKIYVMGGYRASHLSDETKLASAEMYDISEDSWTVIAKMRNPRAAFSACVINRQIFAVGGDKKGFHQEEKTIEYYDTISGKWSLILVPEDIVMDSMSSLAITI